MTPQRACDLALMTVLYGRMDARLPPLKVSGLKTFLASKEKISPERVDHSLRQLSTLKMLRVEVKDEAEGRVSITAYGIEWFEEHFDFFREGDNYELEVRKSPIVFQGPRVKPVGQAYAAKSNGSAYAAVDWGKWGALAGIAAIPLAIILWWLSN